ncbi:MAG: ABC-F family ATP-binding cassette domain-containing protein [Clostridia bacterium]|nr:ABC-F family ATP-binding cassette domain-containing protein [Clostridia bacterium]
MIELSLQNISKFYGANQVFSDVSFELHTKGRVGLIGRNGTGKTTVFKIIAGVEPINGGQIFYKKNSTVGYLDQIPDYPGMKAVEVLKLAFEEVFMIEKEMKTFEEKLMDCEHPNYEKYLKQYGELQHTFEFKGGYQVDEKINRICSGFKFDEEFIEKSFDILSGGEKTRVILAKILLEQPSILLLDEPTNHLDLDSVEWLEAYLKDYDGTVLIISHDRYFLDHVVTEIYEIEQDKTHRYLGNYSYYVTEKERRLLAQLEQYQQQQKKIKAMEEAIKRFRDWGTRADNEQMFVKAKAMEKRIDRIEKIDRPMMEQKKMGLAFNEEKRSGKEVVRMRELSKSFEDKKLLINSEADIYFKDFVAFLGKNGSGKTTVLKMILGQEEPDEGLVKLTESAKVGYMEQEIFFEHPEKSILDLFKETYALTELDARRKLARFLFYSDDVFKIVSNLSGGEKVRLSLCMMMEEKINFLILDEPTNHVDIDSREMIEQALRQFGGTVLFISHDRYFIDQLATKVIQIEDQKLVTYDGNYQYFKEEYEKKKIEPVKTQKEKNVVANKTEPQTTNKKSGLNIFKQKEKETLEIEIAYEEEKLENLKAEMSQESNYEKLMTLQKNIENVQIVLEGLLEKWMTYEEDV